MKRGFRRGGECLESSNEDGGGQPGHPQEYIKYFPKKEWSVDIEDLEKELAEEQTV